MKLPTTEFYGKFSFNFGGDLRNTIKMDLLKMVHCLPSVIKNSLFKIPNFLLRRWITLEEYNLIIPAKHFLWNLTNGGLKTLVAFWRALCKSLSVFLGQ